MSSSGSAPVVVPVKGYRLSELEGELVGDARPARMVGLATVEHECEGVSHNGDRGVPAGRDRRKQRVLWRDEAASTDFLARRRHRQALPQIAANRTW